jgi:hypothetical protein
MKTNLVGTMVIALGVLLAAALSATGQRATTAQPQAAQASGGDIVDLLEAGAIEVAPQGGGITSLSLRVRRIAPHPVTVRVPVGTFFVARNTASQNMVATAAVARTLTSTEWVTIPVPVACANRPRNIPRAGDAFTIQRSPQQADLARLMPVLDKARASFDVKQAAVWIVTDNASYSAMGILVRGGSRVVGAADAARAMQLYAEAGLDLTTRAIWRDRQHILSQLADGDLKRWLQAQG